LDISKYFYYAFYIIYASTPMRQNTTSETPEISFFLVRMLAKFSLEKTGRKSISTGASKMMAGRALDGSFWGRR
jgi:hypothetical protein